MIRPVAPVGGGPPARSPHTSFARSDRSRSPARPRRRPHAPQPGPLNVARNSLATTSNFEVTLLELQRFQRLLKLHPIELRAKFWKTVPQLIQQVARWCSRFPPHQPSHHCKQPSARTRHRPQAPQPGPINVARNSLATTSNFEVTLLELQRFQRLLKLHPIELRAKFWKTVPQLIQQVARWCSRFPPHQPSHHCKQPSARTRHRPQAPQPGPINVARNSLATTSNFEVTLLELQRFQRLLKLHPNELRAKFWKTVPQLTQQVARRHERPQPPAARPHQCRT